MNYPFTNADFLATSIVFIDDLQYKLTSILPSIQYINMNGDQGGAFNMQINFSSELSPGDYTILVDFIHAYDPGFTLAEYQSQYCNVMDKKDAGFNGGTFTSGAWQTRTLNYIEGNKYQIQIDSNQLHIKQNKYTLTIRACAYNVRSHQLRLYNSTDSQVVAYGETSFANGDVNTFTLLNVQINYDHDCVFEIQHRCETTTADMGFGKAAGFGDEIYLTCNIQFN
jgi:hypothetical protein